MTFSLLALFCLPDMGIYDITRLVVRKQRTDELHRICLIILVGLLFLKVLLDLISFAIIFLNLDGWVSILRVNNTAGVDKTRGNPCLL